jgi:uncharacterized protein (DUF2252 family)
MKGRKPGLPRPVRRQGPLTARRNAKMARTTGAFIRGSTARFYAWLDASRARIPRGPPVWICGDCHLGNLGPIAGPEDHIDIEIRDFDQATIGNPAYDLIRLGLSLAAEARGSDLSGVTTARMLEQLVHKYAMGLTRRHRPDVQKDATPKLLLKLMRVAASRSWRQLADDRIEGTSPMIPLGERFWPISAKERAEVERLSANREVRALVTCLRRREDDARIKLLDAAYWVKGCSSLGRLRYAVLLGVVDKRGKIDDHCLLDIKQAVRSVAPAQGGRSLPGNAARRVVEAARRLSPPIGERMLAARFLGRPVFVRELRPQDMKPRINRLSTGQAIKLAGFLASVLARAHGRQMTAAARRSWQRTLLRQVRNGDAPSWLWSTVVELMARHERAYLEHCRHIRPAALAG